MEKSEKKKSEKIIFKAADFFVMLIFISVIIFSFIRIKHSSSENLYLLVQTPLGQYIYSLEKDADFFVEGEKGQSHISIKAKSAAILDSECPNKTCVTSGAIKRYGEWIACIPNRILIRIEGTVTESDKNKLDALSF